jgi:hypothetical protein
MRTDKPKGKTPSLIGSTLGTPGRRVVERKSYCKRCNVPIAKGTECCEIPQLGGTFRNARPYCDACFRLILEQTKRELDALFAGQSWRQP